MMFCLGQGLRSGRRAAMAANFGIAVGGMVHTTLAALGLGALVAAHPAAFEAIRWLGVGYLLWLAVGALRAGPRQRRPVVRPSPRWRFVQALMVNLLNPKVILFILAFLPQFVDPARPILPQFLTLGLVFSAGRAGGQRRGRALCRVHRPAGRAVGRAVALAFADQCGASSARWPCGWR